MILRKLALSEQFLKSKGQWTDKLKVPNSISFKAVISEWCLVISALESYKNILESKVKHVEDEDMQNETYDDLERLERLIPDFRAQFKKEYSEPQE